MQTLPHDPEAFTQGLLLYNNVFYESTGRESAGQDSTIRAYEHNDPAGVVVDVTPQLFEQWLPNTNLNSFFGEGLARVGNMLYQLTWRENTALIYEILPEDPYALVPAGVFEYEGEGWGLCYDGEVLYMTNGTSQLQTRDPKSFELIETRKVTLGGQPVDLLNELECANGYVWANVWKSDDILRINPETAAVEAVLGASRLNQPRPDNPEAVLNGIAYDPDTDTFWLTGKLWDTIYEVRIL